MSKPYRMTCIIIGAMIAVLITILFLYFQKTFTVTFDTKGGTIYKAVEVKPNAKVMKPLDPVMEGYTFEGWYLEATDKSFDFSEKIVSDITITAKWKPIV